ncbi:DUF2721 domain-containing protein [Mesorhizobium sp. B2-3-3]|nr:DUF2721 domain-containing protein [Mesorhizobium sp. B2-3-3]
MQPEVDTIAHVIQLSVAPVFLLTAVVAMLGVLTNRLARAIDRTMVLEDQVGETPAEARDLLDRELKLHSRRIRIIYGAMALCTLCGLLISGVVITLFAGALLAISIAIPIAVQFVAAVLALIGALIAFLKEVHLATTHHPR